MQDIESIDDVKTMVDTFYAKIQKDELLGPIFNRVIEDRWPEHLEKMYGFWQSILLNVPAYSGRPFPPQMKLDVSKIHFETWVTLFTENIQTQFKGVKADEAVARAKLMAALFLSKIEHFRKEGPSLMDR
jgi:hemoglobin